MVAATTVTPSTDIGSRRPHVFEIRTTSTVFFVGEDPTREDEEVVVSHESGIGREQAQHWEHSIRQALMPVTPQPSSEAEPKSQCLTVVLTFNMPA